VNVLLVLTVLSVLALWAFLTVLVIALLLIRKVLEAVRRSLEQITMGVRAIEVQTAPLGTATLGASASLGDTIAEFTPILAALADVERDLQTALPALRRRGGLHA
jgi:uncharacterized protein YoxC